MKNDLKSLRVGDKIMCATDKWSGGVRGWKEQTITKVGRDYIYVSLHGWDKTRFVRDGSGNSARTVAYHAHVLAVREPLLARIAPHVHESWDRKAVPQWVHALSTDQIQRIVAILEEPRS